MACSIDATVGGASANSYITSAAADTYFDNRLQGSEWDTATADEKCRALVSATRRLDFEKFEGEKETTGQALKWPRLDATDDDGEEFDSDAIPQIVLDATCEMALLLLNDNASSKDSFGDTGLEGFKRVRVGPVEVEPRMSAEGSELPEVVRKLLRPVLITPGLSGRLLRA